MVLLTPSTLIKKKKKKRGTELIKSRGVNKPHFVQRTDDQRRKKHSKAEERSFHFTVENSQPGSIPLTDELITELNLHILGQSN